MITWVDGSDPAHVAKRAALREASSHREADLPTRWKSSREIYWCIASILQNAPFVRRIHVATDDQRPADLELFERSGLCEAGRIVIVDHREVFEGYEDALPTFNSLSIEAVLHRIPGLSEHFVYFNDDFFLNRPVAPKEFFGPDGIPVLRGTWEAPDRRRPKMIVRRFLRKLRGSRNMRPSYRVAHEVGAQLAGVTGNFLLTQHLPRPMRRSTIEAFHREHADALPRQLGYRLRHRDQYLPASLANHLEFRREGAPTQPDTGMVYYKPGARFSLDEFVTAVEAAEEPFGCLQSLDEAPASVAARLETVMDRKFGTAAFGKSS